MTPPLVPPTGSEPTGFAQVYDLALARARRGEGTAEPADEPVIPLAVLEEMEAASRMWHALHAQGHELRFEPGPGGVRAELRTVGGDVVRQVPLREAIDVGGGPDFAA
ncbi:MAG TPA: hypothetical protein VGW75_10290 [Solirubrobacteraceae bacterium]|jgi:hypothetical protein|nr:hypothetical protein [Solirubrobacteraceae bacterium]